MNRKNAAALCAVFVCAAAHAQPVIVAPLTATPIIAVARPTVNAQGGAQLPANTEIWMNAVSEVNTKRIKQGDKFEMVVSRDVMLGDYVVIPRNTRGWGQVSYRTGKGAFGKSAKMEFEIVDIELGGRQIPVRGHYRIEGRGNTGATIGTVVAAGVFAAFVTGRSAIIAPATEYKALTVDALPIALAVSVPIATTAAVAPTANPAIVEVATTPKK